VWLQGRYETGLKSTYIPPGGFSVLGSKLTVNKTSKTMALVFAAAELPMAAWSGEEYLPI
jgi:hypothetical protein